MYSQACTLEYIGDNEAGGGKKALLSIGNLSTLRKSNLSRFKQQIQIYPLWDQCPVAPSSK